MSVLRAVLIPADGTKPVQVVEVGKQAAEIAAAIGCKWIETVRTTWLRDRRLLMVVNEEGLEDGAPVNARATRIYESWAIKGDVLIVADGGEDMASLHPAQLGQIVALDFLDSVMPEPAVQP